MTISLSRLVTVLFALALGACSSAPASGPSAPEPEARPDPVRERNLASFDQVWETIRDKHFDPELGGLDWEAVRDELRPKVEAAASVREARPVIEEMLSRLGQSHFGIIAGDAYEAMHGDAAEADEPADEGGAGVGIDVRIDGDAALVVSVEPDSPAAAAGVGPGWIVSAIDGEELAAVFAEVDEGLADETHRPVMLAGAVQHRLGGAPGSRVAVTFLDGDDEPVEHELERVEPDGEAAVLGHLPPIVVQYDSRLIGDDVGYIRFSAFLDPTRIMGAFTGDLETFADARGLVIDLRGNPGGLGAMAIGLGGWFVTEPNQSLGTMITRETSLKFVLNPQPRPYRGRVAVLIDELSMSTSEIFAAGLQDLGRARLFGRPSPGAALPSIIERLPNGDGFQYAFANYVSAGGQTLEGRGVVPDVEVPLDRRGLLDGGDPTLDAALDWIRTAN